MSSLNWDPIWPYLADTKIIAQISPKRDSVEIFVTEEQDFDKLHWALTIILLKSLKLIEFETH